MDYGFVRVAAAVPDIKVAGCGFNTDRIIEMINEAEEAGVQIIAFPECSITAYTCGDLFQQKQLTDNALMSLQRLAESTCTLNILSIVGLPLLVGDNLFNCAAAVQNGEILGIIPKTHISGHNGLDETRWFASGDDAAFASVDIFGKEIPFGMDLLFEAKNATGVSFGIEVCEDLWLPISPSSYKALAGATILFNIGADNEIIGKREFRREMVIQQSSKCMAGYVFVSAGVDESTTDMVFGGHTLIAEGGKLLNEGERFVRSGHMLIGEIDVHKMQNGRLKQSNFRKNAGEMRFRKIPFTLRHVDIKTLARKIKPHPFVPSDEKTRNERCSEIFEIQAAGLAKRMNHTGISKAVIGVSGGLDSTLALIVIAKAFDLLSIPRKNIIGISMPGFGTTNETFSNARALIKVINAEYKEINIEKACLQHFEDIGHDRRILDVTYENVQARERTQILMDIANKEGGLVIGTGDLSEMALGWCTYNGDHMSMYSINSGIPKTLVRHLVHWAAVNAEEEAVADLLLRILNTPITPELLPPDENGEILQKTEDIIGPYELHDFFMYHILRYGAPPKKVVFLAKQAFKNAYTEETIKKWLKVFYKRFFSQQFKRSCQPDGPKIGTISLSPRGGWNMPSDATAEIWLRELE